MVGNILLGCSLRSTPPGPPRFAREVGILVADVDDLVWKDINDLRQVVDRF